MYSEIKKSVPPRQKNTDTAQGRTDGKEAYAVARGKKRSPEDIYAVMSLYFATQSYSETGRKLKIPAATVKDIVAKHKDEPEFLKMRDEQTKIFIKTASRIVEKTLTRLERSIDDESKYIPVNQLTVVIGTLLDKINVENGKPTQNTKVTFDLPESVKKYAK